MKIGIIGMGVAGISVIREIKKQLPKENLSQIELIIFTDKKLFGTGLAYQIDDSCLLINQPTESMSIIPERPTDFTEWVKEKKELKHASNSHVPRFWFGEYLIERLEEWMTDLTVKIIYEKAENIIRTKNKKYHISSKTINEEVDMIHLTTGHLAYQDPYRLKGKENYFYHPYPMQERIKIKNKKAHIGIIGTDLTALDAMLYIKKHYPSVQLSFFSLNGRFSSVRGNSLKKEVDTSVNDSFLQMIENYKQNKQFNSIKEWFIEEAEKLDVDLRWVWHYLGSGTIEGIMKDFKHLDELGRVQWLISQTKKDYPLLWNALTDSDKQYFIQNYEYKLLNFKTPIPKHSANKLISEVHYRNTPVYSDISSIQKNGLFTVELRSGESIDLNYLVNATGQNTNLNQIQTKEDSLIKQLINDGLIETYKFGGVKIDYLSMSAINSHNQVNQTFKVYGQLASGIHYGNSNVELISKSAVHGVTDMIK